MAQENVRIQALHDRLVAGLQDIEQIFINGRSLNSACRTT
jgi:cysteine desulfurase